MKAFKVLSSTVFMIFAITSLTFAQQWGGSSNQNGNIYRTGNVGIGTSTLASFTKLHVKSGNNTQLLVGDSQGTFNLHGFINSGDNYGYNSISSNAYWNGSWWYQRNTSYESWVIQQKVTDNNTGLWTLGYGSKGPHTLIPWQFHFTVHGNGNVGIGTGLNAPSHKLEVTGSVGIDDYIKHNGDTNTRIGFTSNDQIRLRTSGSDRLTVSSGGNIGIGTTSPNKKLEVKGDSRITDYSPELQLWDLGAQHKFGFKVDNYRLQFHIWDANGNHIAEKMSFTQDGRLGIGTTNPQSKLAVNGKITAKEVEVTLTGWADFVFDEEYNLMPLNEVEKYVNQNRHLPNIPSEREVLENGVKLGEMQKKLLQKIEELTLYIIDLKKENEVLKKRVDILEEN